jgi:colanic acid/amylovoran biosynthesis glycosyltransferase
VHRKPVVVLYRNNMFWYSETFIRNQGEGLRRFTPYYVGVRLFEDLPPPAERTIVVNRGGVVGKAKEALWKMWGVAPGLRRQVRKLDPVLVHAHFGPDGVHAMSLARSLRVPLLVTFWGSDATMDDEHLRRSPLRSERAYLRHREALKREARLFIAVSKFIKDKLVEQQNFPPGKVVVNYNAVDTGTLQPDPAVPREPVVLFVGRLVEKKGVEYLIQAMSRVQAEMPDAELVIIGGGPLRPELEELATKLLNRHRFLGVQPPSVVRNWMNRALLLGAPSVTASTGDSEGMPTVVLEAQAMGLPVVGTAHSGISEAVSHGQTGFLVAERDWEALAERIARLLKDKALWQEFSHRGQERMRTTFSADKQIRELENIYDRVMRGDI